MRLQASLSEYFVFPKTSASCWGSQLLKRRCPPCCLSVANLSAVRVYVCVCACVHKKETHLPSLQPEQNKNQACNLHFSRHTDVFLKSHFEFHIEYKAGGAWSLTMVSVLCQHVVDTQLVKSVVEYKVGKETLKLKSELDSQQPVCTGQLSSSP